MTGTAHAYSREELSKMLREMDAASAEFYSRATAIGHHAFIEFCGLMNEYTKICREALEVGGDFTESSVHSGGVLPAKSYHIEYIAEKFECIFGPTLRANPDLAELFVSRALGRRLVELVPDLDDDRD